MTAQRNPANPNDAMEADEDPQASVLRTAAADAGAGPRLIEADTDHTRANLIRHTAELVAKFRIRLATPPAGP